MWYLFMIGVTFTILYMLVRGAEVARRPENTSTRWRNMQ